jgi:ribonuclease HI
MDNTFHVFTDGSVIGNPGPGGWAAVLMSGDKRREMSGSSPWTTISEMELLAAVEALRSIPAGSSVQLCSDSELLISTSKAKRTNEYRLILGGGRASP